MHDTLTGRSVTACLHFLNATPIDWYSKKMATVESATYGAEIVAAMHVFIHTQWTDVATESISEWQANEANPKKYPNICSIYWRALQQVW